MDLYLQGLPRNVSKKTLESGLQPYMNALGVQYWSCNNPFKKDFAFVSFLRTQDANAFLQRHGASRPKAPKLHIFNSAIYVTKSKKPPDMVEIQHLAHRKSQQATNFEPLPAASTALPLHQIAYGHLMFLEKVQDTPTFMRQSDSQQCGDHSTAKFAKRTLIVKYDGEYRVDIPYSAIWDMVLDPKTPMATLILTEVPRFFNTKSGLPGGADSGHQNGRGPKLFRIGHLGGRSGHQRYVADCLVYQLTFQTSYTNFRQTMESVYKKNYLPYSLWRIPAGSAVGATDFPYSLGVLNSRMISFNQASILPFGILFQVNALVRNNYVEPNVAMDMLKVLMDEFMSAKVRGLPPPLSAHTFKFILGDIPYPVPGIDPVRLTAQGILTRLFESERSGKARLPYLSRLEKERSARQSWVLKAVVTPTRITFHGPDLETNNRILRKFSDFTEYFLRVQFCEEDGEDLFFNPTTSHDIVLERFKDVFNKGIPIAGRIYGFLGFSHSSLRSHSAWFAAPFTDHEKTLQTHVSIIRELGNFKHIQIPARCAARIGQAFTETPFSVNLAEHGIQHDYVPDVKSADGERVFSDGVGTISLEAAKVLWRVLPNTSNKASCFQIRWAGAKGMLSLDQRLVGRLFRIRDSMVKFEGADQSELEICDMSSRPLRLVLNQQMIKIMEDLGVKEDWFFRQQERELDNLKGVTRSIENTAAFLHVQDVGTAIDLSKFVKRLDRRNIDYHTDLFLRSLVETVVLRELRLLKHKARIPVRKGMTLFGVMDETGFLGENEVYITYDRTYHGARGLVDSSLEDGPVLVTRSPALHPGDIQVCYQRTPPARHTLLALNNCIVFSRHGKRDLPSMLSGGDLDGDIYNVIWDPDAMPARTFNAADYPRTVAQPLGREVEKADMAKFFVDFMRTDQLGIIATRHLILADKKEEGTLDAECLRLSVMHSQAVDFSKTGIPVDVSEMPNYKPRFRPDFLAPAPPAQLHDLNSIGFLDLPETKEDEEEAAPEFKFYRSEKLLGKLYRRVDEKDIWSAVHRAVPKGTPSIWEQLLGVVEAELEGLGLMALVGWEERMKEAHEIKMAYETNIWDIRALYGANMNAPLTELEVLTGSVFNRAGKQTRRQRENSIKIKERTGDVFSWLVALLRHGGDPALSGELDAGPDDAESVVSGSAGVEGGGMKRFETRVRALGLCLACLRVAGEGGVWGARRKGGGEEMRSFGVVAGSCLLRILDGYLFEVEEGRRRATRVVSGGRGGEFVGVRA